MLKCWIIICCSIRNPAYNKARGSINEQSKTLQSYGFARIHKSYCVNLRHIKLLGAAGLDCAGTTLPIGRTYKTSLMQEYLRFLGSVER
ncbi:LytTR family transcriptional regulator DNA-binding domain-containing protein [Bifidobacterium dentium]|uniref:LytTR family transcriptional regulator DNA-binding domain-containing protein n=1 Tax=Bifidobacterium dentium TaxID=1689 RepID=UPI001F504E5E|nr:LytTR family transcriptional regulator DNA-binding domain-containing protein [Bifidobacterium dentium]